MNAVSRELHRYYDQIPDGTAQAAAKGFILSVAGAVVLGVVFSPGVTIQALVTTGVRTGLVAALATVIHSTMVPLLYAFNINTLALPFEFCRRAVEWCLIAAIASMHPAFRINVQFSIIITAAFLLSNLVTHNIWDYPVNEPAIMIPALETVVDNRHYTYHRWQ